MKNENNNNYCSNRRSIRDWIIVTYLKRFYSASTGCSPLQPIQMIRRSDIHRKAWLPLHPCTSSCSGTHGGSRWDWRHRYPAGSVEASCSYLICKWKVYNSLIRISWKELITFRYRAKAVNRGFGESGNRGIGGIGAVNRGIGGIGSVNQGIGESRNRFR